MIFFHIHKYFEITNLMIFFHIHKCFQIWLSFSKKLLDATKNNNNKLLMAHQEKVRHCYQCTYGAPLGGAPLVYQFLWYFFKYFQITNLMKFEKIYECEKISSNLLFENIWKIIIKICIPMAHLLGVLHK